MSLTTCQVSVYPLDVPDAGSAVRHVLDGMSWDGVEVTVGPMSTLVRGEEIFTRAPARREHAWSPSR